MPSLITSVVCPGGQGDVSIVENLLIMSVEETRGRVDCGREGVGGEPSQERFRGIRIFDISDVTNPVQVGIVQTCRGSHTHSVVSGPDKNGKIKEVFFFALEYASGGEFFDYVVECAKFNQKLTRYYFHQLLLGLQHCHKNRVYHRDIKMENLILDSNYNLKIIDFGLAAVLKDDESEKL